MSYFTVKASFQNDLINIARQELHSLCSPQAAKGDPDRILRRFVNMQRRTISARPRKILKSKEFTCPEDLHEGLRQLEEKISKGADINPHLSRRIPDPDFEDGILNDWNIQHLHLGTTSYTTGKRIGGSTLIRADHNKVLFAFFKHDRAYFIDVRDHDDRKDPTVWTQQDMPQIIVENWPDLVDEFHLDGMSVTSFDDESRAKLRKNSMVPITANGKVFVPFGGGIATDGSGFAVTFGVDNLRRIIKDVEEEIKRDIDKHVPQLLGREDVDRELEFHLVLRDTQFMLVNEKYGQTIRTQLFPYDIVHSF